MSQRVAPQPPPTHQPAPSTAKARHPVSLDGRPGRSQCNPDTPGTASMPSLAVAPEMSKHYASLDRTSFPFLSIPDNLNCVLGAKPEQYLCSTVHKQYSSMLYIAERYIYLCYLYNNQKCVDNTSQQCLSKHILNLAASCASPFLVHNPLLQRRSGKACIGKILPGIVGLEKSLSMACPAFPNPLPPRRPRYILYQDRPR